MKCQRSVVNHQEEVRIDLLEVNSIHDRLDIGPVIGVLIIDHPSYALMLTVDEEEDRMVDLHLTPYLAPNRLRDEIRVHINPSQR